MRPKIETGVMKMSAWVWRCLALVWLSATGTLAWAQSSPKIDQMVPLYGQALGVVQEGRLYCFMAFDDDWVRCDAWHFMPLPADTRRVLGNERTLALVRQAQVDFFDEAGHPKRHPALPWPKEWAPQRAINGTYSTESDVVVLHEGQMHARTGADPDDRADRSFDCSQAFDGGLFHYGNGSVLAQVHAQGVRFLVLRKTSTGLACAPDEGLAFTAPPGMDEMIILGRSHIAVRQGRHVSFYGYARADKKWVPAHQAPITGGELPLRDLTLP